jgi:3-hydroxyacyl-[acyl-carrier-protein] dehydratase
MEKVKDILPHGEGFTFVDEIIQVEKGKHIVAVKKVKEDEFWVPHHFPGNPVMPGVLVIEAMAQACALLVLVSFPELRGIPFYLAGVKEARFKKPVVPPSQLTLEAFLKQRREMFGFLTQKHLLMVMRWRQQK